MPIPRRSFASLAATALSAARVYGVNDRIRIGLIGCGGRGKQDWTTLLKDKDAQAVVVCHLFEPFRGEVSQMAGGIEQATDFRRVLDRKDMTGHHRCTAARRHARVVQTGSQQPLGIALCNWGGS